MGFIMGVPPNVAAVWFGPEQVSSACSIGVFGNQLGVALGFLLPPMMVGSHDGDIIAIGADLSQLFYILAGLSSAVSIVVLIRAIIMRLLSTRGVAAGGNDHISP